MRNWLSRLVWTFVFGILAALPCPGASSSSKPTSADKKALDRWTPVAMALRDEGKKVLAEFKEGQADTSMFTLRWARLNEETLVLVERLESADLRESAKETASTLRAWYEEFETLKEKREKSDVVERLIDFLSERMKR
ncbi:MAG: hypothetical protein IT186_05485 [Acidobacteria bacterium]|nr:hypothetical protein [Acidobacteriota bacterium]MCG3194726.1 hypothetical protein [Thermoanaerobaculia bacterium]